MKALQLTSNQCFYRGKVGLSEFHYSGGSTSKVHASTESNEALCEYYEERKRLCTHRPFGNAIHHVWYDNVMYIVGCRHSLPLLFEISLWKVLQYMSPQK